MVLESQEILLTGTPICRGIAIGRPFFFTLVEYTVAEQTIDPIDLDNEVSRYQKAIERARDDIKGLRRHLQREKAYDGLAILDAHLQMMQDPLMTTEVEIEIRRTQKNAEFVFQSIVNEYKKKFDSLVDPFFRERFKDIQDISRRVLSYLHESVRECLGNIPHDSIVFATDLTAFDTAEANNLHIGAFVTRDGGATSHAAIVAKAKGIPYVSSVDLEDTEAYRDMWVIVDGRTGEIILNPSPRTMEKYQQLRSQLQIHLQRLKEGSKLEAETYDGYRIRLSANIETPGELDVLHQYGASGVGLLRTESAFLANEVLPTEQEQFEIYRQFVEKMKGLPIVVRTFDFGGDKYWRNQQMPQEANPFLGCRAIRYMLKEKSLFKIQLKAILRASAFGDVRVMFPMVSSLAELREAKELLKETQRELIDQGIPVAEYIPIGCMIEVPSAAIIADLLAQECDFLSIGTNDLVQYALAVDRSNSALSHLYTTTHPSVIRLIKLVVSEANYHGIPVSICGEVAADPRFTPLLLGLGIHELSVASRYLPVVKNAIRNISIVAASKMVEEAMKLSSAAEIEALFTQEYFKNVPEDCFYNC